MSEDLDAGATKTAPQTKEATASSLFYGSLASTDNPNLREKFINSPAGCREAALLGDKFPEGISLENIKPVTNMTEGRIFGAAESEEISQLITSIRHGDPAEAYRSAQRMLQVFEDTIPYISWMEEVRSKLLGKKACLGIRREVLRKSGLNSKEVNEIIKNYERAYVENTESIKKQKKAEMSRAQNKIDAINNAAIMRQRESIRTSRSK